MMTVLHGALARSSNKLTILHVFVIIHSRFGCVYCMTCCLVTLDYPSHHVYHPHIEYHTQTPVQAFYGFNCAMNNSNSKMAAYVCVSTSIDCSNYFMSSVNTPFHRDALTPQTYNTSGGVVGHIEFEGVNSL